MALLFLFLVVEKAFTTYETYCAMIKKYALSALLLFLGLHLPAQLTLQVTAIPDNTPEDAVIHLAGNFNNWDPGHPDYILTESEDGALEITIDPSPGQLEFKFTRGSWATVEGNAAGGFLPNRTYAYEGAAQTTELTILSWEDLGGSGGNSTAADNVTVLAEDFYIPHLDRYRRIWLYLPPDYETSEKAYPVLYMQDGQNVFDAATSFAGEWEVDEALNALFEAGNEGVIVVAIDNGGAERINEYSPWINPDYGGGQGDQYLAFITETLKPHIDANYRTLPGREHTGIMGSSLGGLISFYGAIEYQEVFSKAGVFSPSFWFAEECYSHVAQTGKAADMRIYLLAGESEGNGAVVADMQAMYDTLLSAGFSEAELAFVTHADGAHSEWYWAREFPAAYEWLFGTLTSVAAADPPATLQLYPNPANDRLFVVKATPWKTGRALFFDTAGKVVATAALPRTGGIDTSALAPGVYTVLIYEMDQVLTTQRIIITR